MYDQPYMGNGQHGRLLLSTQIDPAEGVEPVEMMEPGIMFKGDIIIECKKQALQEAKKHRTVLVLWTDGSKLDQGNVRVAVC